MKKGFTLIELLAVIIILSLIAIISTISIKQVLNNSKVKLQEEQIRAIESAARQWGTENMDSMPASVSLTTLKKAGYLSTSQIKDPTTNKSFTGIVCITESNNQYNYTYKSSC